MAGKRPHREETFAELVSSLPDDDVQGQPVPVVNLAWLVWGEEVADALRLCADNEAFSQQTRHRAWQYVKPKPSTRT